MNISKNVVVEVIVILLLPFIFGFAINATLYFVNYFEFIVVGTEVFDSAFKWAYDLWFKGLVFMGFISVFSLGLDFWSGKVLKFLGK